MAFLINRGTIPSVGGFPDGAIPVANLGKAENKRY